MADSTAFVEFLLLLILKAVEEIIRNEKRVTVKVTVKVTVNQKKILEAVKKNPYVTLDNLSEKIGISRKSIAANVKKLQEAGMLKRQGANKNGYWEVQDK